MQNLKNFISNSYFWFQSLVFFGMAALNFSNDRRFWCFTAAALACQGWAQLLESLRRRD
jgi:hypothetical protein